MLTHLRNRWMDLLNPRRVNPVKHLGPWGVEGGASHRLVLCPGARDREEWAGPKATRILHFPEKPVKAQGCLLKMFYTASC